ncbi:MAG TPA: hypothetical protein VN673_02540, partial [Clostridia bacterium]|nr:hypothetical protein [Clostridia bacterium]
MKKLVVVLGLALAGWIAYTLWNPRSHPNSAAGTDPATGQPPEALAAAAGTGAAPAATSPPRATNAGAPAISAAQKRPWDPQFLQGLYHE